MKILTLEQLKQLRDLYANEPIYINTLFKEKRTGEIEKALSEKIPVWRIAKNLDICEKTVTRIRDGK